jgi:hypothetical protein
MFVSLCRNHTCPEGYPFHADRLPGVHHDRRRNGITHLAAESAAAHVGGIRASADQRCEQVLSDLRDANFAGVIAQLDAATKAQLSADQLQSAWGSLPVLFGQLTGWKLAQSQTAGGLQTGVAAAALRKYTVRTLGKGSLE